LTSVLDAVAENLPRPVTVVLNTCFFFPHSPCSHTQLQYSQLEC